MRAGRRTVSLLVAALVSASAVAACDSGGVSAKDLHAWTRTFCRQWSDLRGESYATVKTLDSTAVTTRQDAIRLRTEVIAALDKMSRTARAGTAAGVPNVENGTRMAPLFGSYFHTALASIADAHSLATHLPTAGVAAFNQQKASLSEAIGELNRPDSTPRFHAVNLAWSKAYKLDTSGKLYAAFSHNQDCIAAGGFGE